MNGKLHSHRARVQVRIGVRLTNWVCGVWGRWSNMGSNKRYYSYRKFHISQLIVLPFQAFHNSMGGPYKHTHTLTPSFSPSPTPATTTTTVWSAVAPLRRPPAGTRSGLRWTSRGIPQSNSWPAVASHTDSTDIWPPSILYNFQHNLVPRAIADSNPPD
jgi:hypothetical protein